MDALEAIGIEDLHDGIVILRDVAVVLEGLEHGSRDLLAFRLVEPGRLDLHIQADIASGGVIQALDHLDLFAQGVQAEVRLAQREALRVVGDLLAILDGEALAERQLAQLVQREVDGVVAAIITRTLGEDLGDIGHTVQEAVVQHHQLVILAHHHVLLEEVGALGIGHRLGREGVLRQVARGTPVGDHDLVGAMAGVDAAQGPVISECR